SARSPVISSRFSRTAAYAASNRSRPSRRRATWSRATSRRRWRSARMRLRTSRASDAIPRPSSRAASRRASASASASARRASALGVGGGLLPDAGRGLLRGGGGVGVDLGGLRRELGRPGLGLLRQPIGFGGGLADHAGGRLLGLGADLLGGPARRRQHRRGLLA